MNERSFQFGDRLSSVHISRDLPSLGQIAKDYGGAGGFFKPLFICDENTRPLVDRILEKGGLPGGTEAGKIPRCILPSGERAKTWASVEAILRAAADGGLGRDGVFIGVGGGVAGDLAAFGASIYMRGCGLCLVSTTLLGMVDASLGGKTGIDLWGIKNLAGTFYPARHVYMPLECLKTLPPEEWKSGLAELIKTAVLEGEDFEDCLRTLGESFSPGGFPSAFPEGFIHHVLEHEGGRLSRCISRAAALKGRIVETDPRETGGERRLLNLGHTFGHALEASAGLGKISHGEAVAWGLARACELGYALGICPRERAEKISALLRFFGYQLKAPHPLMDIKTFQKALDRDKKKAAGKIVYIVPETQGARPVPVEEETLIQKIINGALSF